MAHPNIHYRFIAALAEVTGPSGILRSEPDMAGYLTDWRRRYSGNALAVVLPSTVDQVSQLVKLCRDAGIAVVPQAGNTGLTGGAIPPTDRPSVLLNVSRLARVRAIDAANRSVIVEAGCILTNLREAVRRDGLVFPLLLGSAGSCQVGGLVSTNAGGTGVLRYGNMRDLTLGLEVVLPDGQVWNGLRSLRKDNSGYDLKQLFVGAEGTLGVVTAASLKLFPVPRASGTAMVALPSVQAAVDLLALFSDRVGNRIEAFEIVSRGQLENVLRHSHRDSAPLPLKQPWYVLTELADSSIDWDPHALFESVLAEAVERNLVQDAIIAEGSRAQRLWELRHSVSDSNVRRGFSIANDTSVPISNLPKFIDEVERQLREEFKEAEIFHCGHIGDGNIHVVVVLDRSTYVSEEQREKAAARINLIVHAASVKLQGSISAEHGIGMMHVDELERFKPVVDLDIMARIKTALDPNMIMNPGKILRTGSPIVGQTPDRETLPSVTVR